MKKFTFPQMLPLLPVLPAVLFLATLPAGALRAASTVDKLGEALAARDKGDLATAKKDFEALLAASPGNDELRRDLDDVNAKITAAASAAKTAAAEAKAAKEKAVAQAKAEKAAADANAKEESVAKAKALAAAKAEQQRLNGLYSSADKDAKAKAEAGDFTAAAAVLDAGIKSLGESAAAQPFVTALQAAKADLPVQNIELLLKQGKIEDAKSMFEAYKKTSSDSPKIAILDADIEKTELHPPLPSAKEVSAPFISSQKQVAKLEAAGIAQYNNGDYEEAQRTFRKVLGQDGLNKEAQYFLQKIATILQESANQARETTARYMLNAVTNEWDLPSVQIRNVEDTPIGDRPDVQQMKKRLDSIMIPSVKFNNADMDTVIDAITEMGKKYDPSGVGVNFIHHPDPKKTPTVRLNLVVPVSLHKLLDTIVSSSGYDLQINAEEVILHPLDGGGGGAPGMETVKIAINKPTFQRLSAAGNASAGTATGTAEDPFVTPAAGAGAGATTTGTAALPSGDSGAIQSFLQNAGVNFPAGSNLIYDGAAIIVTQYPKNIERIRNILGNYNEVKQVSIETKFMEVTQGNLSEFGVNWNIGRGRDSIQTPNRDLTATFATAAGTSNAGVLVAAGTSTSDSAGNVITGPPTILPIINNPPTFPGTGDLATEVTNNVGNFSHFIGSFDINAVVRALERKTGTELLSSPSVTVLNDSPASIAVAQELRYPRSYSDARVTTGSSGGNGGGGGASVAIASGTPQDFDTRHIGVELKVTPHVEDDDYNISLDLSPTVTEFEGFVEYGGPNVAAAAGSTLSAPSGFFQPVFSVREIVTKVEIWDGATLVMGGLTREQVRRLNDKTPLLGDIPLIGRLFQSKGETVEKRNLLIFVTANLVSPGGSLKKQTLPGVKAGAKYENATVMTPGGPETRRSNK